MSKLSEIISSYGEMRNMRHIQWPAYCDSPDFPVDPVLFSQIYSDDFDCQRVSSAFKFIDHISAVDDKIPIVVIERISKDCLHFQEKEFAVIHESTSKFDRSDIINDFNNGNISRLALTAHAAAPVGTRREFAIYSRECIVIRPKLHVNKTINNRALNIFEFPSKLAVVDFTVSHWWQNGNPVFGHEIRLHLDSSAESEKLKKAIREHCEKSGLRFSIQYECDSNAELPAIETWYGIIRGFSNIRAYFCLNLD